MRFQSSAAAARTAALFVKWLAQATAPAAAKAVSMVLAGGGLKHCGAYGVTDELAKKPVENPVPLVDFHATIHAALGIDPAEELMDSSRPVPITDGGKAVSALFA